MADNIDTRVSPALDPETYANIEGYHEQAQFVGCVVNAMVDAYDVLGRLHDAKALADSNPAFTPENRVILVGRKAEADKARVLKRLDLAARDLSANIAHAEAQLMEPLKERAGLGSVNREVRAHVKALDRSEREAFMREALDRDDDATLTAVLGAQPFLSGLTQLDRDHYLREFHQKKRPDLVRRLDVMRRFQERLDSIGPIVHAQFAKAIGAEPGVVAAWSRVDAEARAALGMSPTS